MLVDRNFQRYNDADLGVDVGIICSSRLSLLLPAEQLPASFQI